MAAPISRKGYCAATQEANGGKLTAATDVGRGIVAGFAMSVRGGARFFVSSAIVCGVADMFKATRTAVPSLATRTYESTFSF